MLKPIGRAQLAQALDRLRILPTPLRDSTLDDVLRSQRPGSARFLMRLVADSGQYWMDPTLNELEQRLDGASVFLVSRAGIVNLNAITEVVPRAGSSGEIVLKNGQRLEVSLRRFRNSSRKNSLMRSSLDATVCSMTVSSTTDRSIPSKPLTELQQGILDFIWSKGDATADQVREGIARKHPLKESSVRTLLGRLETRGYLTHRLDGKTFVYRATAPPRSLAAGAVRNIIQRFCAGSVEQFLTGMVDEQVLTVEQLERLARKVRSRK